MSENKVYLYFNTAATPIPPVLFDPQLFESVEIDPLG